ncbi:MAG: TRAP transporter small permease subunit [Bacteroidota bacterium]
MRKLFDRALSYLLVILTVVMVSSTLLQVVARYIDLNVQFTEELTIYAMMWLAIFGSAYAFGLKKHIAIDLLSSSLDDSSKWKHSILVELVISVFALLVLIIGGIRLVYITFKLGQVSSIMQVPKGWIYLSLPISGIFILCYNALNILDTLKKRNSR